MLKECPVCQKGCPQKQLGTTFKNGDKTLFIEDFITYVCPVCHNELEVGTDNLEHEEKILQFFKL